MAAGGRGRGNWWGGLQDWRGGGAGGFGDVWGGDCATAAEGSGWPMRYDLLVQSEVADPVAVLVPHLHGLRPWSSLQCLPFWFLPRRPHNIMIYILYNIFLFQGCRETDSYLFCEMRSTWHHEL